MKDDGEERTSGKSWVLEPGYKTRRMGGGVGVGGVKTAIGREE